MRKVRIGNDINVRWEVKTDGKAVSLEGKALKLYVRSAYRKEEITTFTVEGCVVSFTYPASMQRMTGARAVILEDATEGAPRRTVCADQAFTLVAHSCEESDDDVEFEDFMVSLQSNVLIGKPGLSAYEVWLSEGNTGTLEDWYAFLRQPATDIAADVTEAEAARAEAEKKREEAETARQENETARQENETARQEAEEGRAEAELKRIDAEQERADAELLRKNAETKREQAEEKREEAIDGFGKDLNDLAEKLGLKADKDETIVEIKRLTGKQGREWIWNSKIDTAEYPDFEQYLISKGNYCGFYLNLLTRAFTATDFYGNYKPLISFGNGITLAAYRIHTLRIGIFRDETATRVPLYEFESPYADADRIVIAPRKLITSSANNEDGIGIYVFKSSGFVSRGSMLNSSEQISMGLFKSVLTKASNYKEEIGFISYTNSNNYRVKYADGRYALVNTDKNVVIGGKDYNTDTNYHAEGFGENGTTFTRGGTLEVNGSAQVRDLTTRSITANGSVTVNNELNVMQSIRTEKTLEAGETTIKGTLHCETHDIKTKSVYPAGTGSSSLKDPSLGAVKGNYVVNKGNLGKPAHNYDKLFVENIFWSDRTDFLNPETSLNTGYWHSVYRIFSKKGYKGRPTFYTDYSMYNELNDGYQIGIFSDMKEGLGGNENITMFYTSNDEDPEAMFCFNLDRGYIKHTKYGRSKDCVFGNGVSYNAETKIPATFVDLSAKADLVDGKVPLSQLGNVDTQIVLVVDALPTENIKSNKIYLVKNAASKDEENVYTEYVHINEKWEELGKYKPEIDLSEYIKSNEIYQCIKKDYDSSKRGDYSVAIDDTAIAIGKSSTAFGVNAKANYNYSVALGYNATAVGSDSVAAGTLSSAGWYAIALGTLAHATGKGSIALGPQANVSKEYAIAIGKNAKNNKSIFSVGFNGVNGIDMDADNYGLYLKGFGGFTGTNLTVTEHNASGNSVEKLNPDIKSVQEVINGKADASALLSYANKDELAATESALQKQIATKIDASEAEATYVKDLDLIELDDADIDALWNS